MSLLPYRDCGICLGKTERQDIVGGNKTGEVLYQVVQWSFVLFLVATFIAMGAAQP